MKCPVCGSEMSSMRLEVDYYEWYCPCCEPGPEGEEEESLEPWPGEYEDGTGAAWYPEDDAPSGPAEAPATPRRTSL